MTIFIFIFGLIIGSFLNVCIYRIPLGLSIVTPPSACGSCGQRLKPKDLIPLLSWLYLKGKCRYCGQPISIRYPLVEFITGLIFSLAYWAFGWTWILLIYLIIYSALIAIVFIDIDHQIIPNSINLFLLIIFFISNFILEYIYWKEAFVGGLLGGGFLFLLVLLSRGGAMGMGDVKLMGVLGLFLGWKYTILCLLLSFIIGGVFSVFLLVLKIKGRKDAIAFGPWLVAGFFITTIFGNNILDWYLRLLRG